MQVKQRSNNWLIQVCLAFIDSKNTLENIRMSDVRTYKGEKMMNFKRKLGSSLMVATLGLTLISGGAYAYFSDTATSNNTFAAGTMDLSINPTEIIRVNNMKPGDSMIRHFELHNNGTLDIDKVLLNTSYQVIDANGNNTEDFAEHIQVEFMYNEDKLNEVIYETSLADLKDMTMEAINEHIIHPILGKGLAVGDHDGFVVKFNFVDNGKDQNQFQGDSLSLEWTFTATQTEGEEL